MSQMIQDEELSKAAAHMDRLQDFLAARTEWAVKATDADNLVGLHEALVKAVKIGATPLMHSNAIAILRNPQIPEVRRLPESLVDGDRMRGFAHYVERLTPWLQAQSTKVVSEAGRGFLARLHKAAVATTLAVESILDNTGITYTGLIPAPGTVKAGEEEEVPTGAELEEEDEQDLIDVANISLTFEDTDETPVLQTFKGSVELTHEAKQALEGFLAAAKIKMPEAQMIRLERKIQGWIEGTPPDHVLTLKVSTMDMERRPYPVFVRKKHDL